MPLNCLILKSEGTESTPSIRGTMKKHKFVNHTHKVFFKLVFNNESFCVQKYVTNSQETFIAAIKKLEHTITTVAFAKIATKLMI